MTQTYILQIIGGYGLAMFIDSSFCNDHNIETGALTAALQKKKIKHTSELTLYTFSLSSEP